MSPADVEIVRKLFERMSGGGLDFALELVSEDFSVEVPSELSAEPDTYEGHAGARRYFAGFDGLLEDVRFEPLEIADEGEAVLVWLIFSGRGAASGIEVEQHAAVLVWLTAGKVVRMRPFADVESARQALR
jgi:ketosteroid isomerase-like protein